MASDSASPLCPVLTTPASAVAGADVAITWSPTLRTQFLPPCGCCCSRCPLQFLRASPNQGRHLLSATRRPILCSRCRACSRRTYKHAASVGSEVDLKLFGCWLGAGMPLEHNTVCALIPSALKLQFCSGEGENRQEVSECPTVTFSISQPTPRGRDHCLQFLLTAFWVPLKPRYARM